MAIPVRNDPVPGYSIPLTPGLPTERTVLRPLSDFIPTQEGVLFLIKYSPEVPYRTGAKIMHD